MQKMNLFFVFCVFLIWTISPTSNFVEYVFQNSLSLSLSLSLLSYETSFGSSPPSDTRDEDHDYTSEIYDALDEEWRRHNRVQRTFSPLGFKKGKLPRDVFASMGAFYYNNQYNKVLEEWGGKGVFVNWWETDIYFIQIPWGIKDIWQKSKSTTYMFIKES